MKRKFRSNKKEHNSNSFYITDLSTTDAEYVGKGIRSHWHIENKLHYTKDVIMREDKESTKNPIAAANLGLFRNFVFNILKEKDKSIKYATEIFENYPIKKIMTTLART
ncbi:MAG: hypothetical protein CR986_10545 [Ignavibacteriae bacterium]|nr:MAG: hypothetical protein CR986_10545 [Ignavibacteriota bacterium]